MFTDYEQKLHMFTYYKQAYLCLLSIRKKLRLFTDYE